MTDRPRKDDGEWLKPICRAGPYDAVPAAVSCMIFQVWPTFSWILQQRWLPYLDSISVKFGQWNDSTGIVNREADFCRTTKIYFRFEDFSRMTANDFRIPTTSFHSGEKVKLAIQVLEQRKSISNPFWLSLTDLQRIFVETVLHRYILLKKKRKEK